MPTDSVLRTDFGDLYRHFNAGWSNYLDEARRDMEFALLAQHTEAEWNKADLQKRELLTFDKTKRQLDLLEGYEQRNRHILKIGPAESQDGQTHSGTYRRVGRANSQQAFRTEPSPGYD